MGGTTLFVQHTGVADVLRSIAAEDGAEVTGRFPVLAVFLLERLFTFVFLALIVLFMTTSTNTSTLVVTVLATKRTAAPTTGAVVRWGRFQGAVAVTAVLVGGETFQAVAVLTGGVFAVSSVVAILALGEYAVCVFPHEAVGIRVATAVNSQNNCS